MYNSKIIQIMAMSISNLETLASVHTMPDICKAYFPYIHTTNSQEFLEKHMTAVYIHKFSFSFFLRYTVKILSWNVIVAYLNVLRLWGLQIKIQDFFSKTTLSQYYVHGFDQIKVSSSVGYLKIFEGGVESIHSQLTELAMIIHQIKIESQNSQALHKSHLVLNFSNFKR